MTKATSKGARRRARRRAQVRAAQMADLALKPVPRRHQPRHRGRFAKAEADPQQVVLDARCRKMGISTSEENRRMMNEQMMGDSAGQAITIGATNEAEAKRLWEVFAGLDAADARYHARILGRSRHAKCGRMEYLPERLEARPDDQADARTDAEKDRDAVNAWMRWHGWLGHLAGHERSAIWAGVYLQQDLHREGTLTLAGSAFVAALRALAVVCKALG